LKEGIEMKRSIVVISFLVICVLGFSTSAFPWGFAGHALVDDQLNKKSGHRNLNETYAGLSIDMFNFSFDLPVYEPGGIYEQFHYDYMNVWNQRRKGTEKGLAYGFVSHNDEWGADFTAHHFARAYSYQDGVPRGYVVAKALELWDAAPLPPELEIPEEVALELFHSLVEWGLDILTLRLDPMIGEKMAAAAMYRSPEFPNILVDAFAEGFAPFFGGNSDFAAGVIVQAEEAFRNEIMAIGFILSQGEEAALEIFSKTLADQAEAYLEQFGISLDPSVDIEGMVKTYITLSMSLHGTDENGLPQQYIEEIQATVNYLDEELKARGITNSQYHEE
jgi:hypothetical protein